MPQFSILRNTWHVRMRHIFVVVIGGLYVYHHVTRYMKSGLLLRQFYAVNTMYHTIADLYTVWNYL